MDPFDPALDQPFSIDNDALDPAVAYRLANQELFFTADANTDLRDLFWPWADARYAAGIRMHIADAREAELMPMVTRFYPGYQETILGSEGMIVSKRLAVPLGSHYDRAVFWNLECQAEGDRMLRLDIEIDWGEALTQRMVDGLLVAQCNPRQAQGIYDQHNADSTRVFGNPHGRPSDVELDDANGHARLVYYILVNGIVEVPLLLTISDVGEQIAWSGFLALRDAERLLEDSIVAWDKSVKTGRLWTPNPVLNRAVQLGRLASLRHLHRFRTGLSPTSRGTTDAPALVDCFDGCDPMQSRNLLAHLRRVAEKSEGRLPVLLPIQPRALPEPPGHALPETNSAYLTALHRHLQRFFEASLLAEHYPAVIACAEALIRLPWTTPHLADPAAKNASASGLRHALALALLHKDGVNAVRWESEACELERQLREQNAQTHPEASAPSADWIAERHWLTHDDKPWDFGDPQAGITLAADAVWRGCGLEWKQGELWVFPQKSERWRWWALVDLPISLRVENTGHVTLVWDGETLHSTQPVRADVPVQIHRKISARNTDELDFDLRFEFVPAQDSDQSPFTFRPTFDDPR